MGNGPTEIDTTSFRIVYDYMGEFSDELGDDYFDLVFSISTLEHVPDSDEMGLKNILIDINRVLKPGGISLHCIDVVLKNDYQWANKILDYFYAHAPVVNKFIRLDQIIRDEDMFTMSEKYFSRSWEVTTGKKFEDFGKPVSYNLMWIRPAGAAAEYAQRKSEQKNA